MLGKGHYKQNKIEGKYLQYNTDKGLIYIYLTIKIEDQKNKKQQKNGKSWINNSAHKQKKQTKNESALKHMKRYSNLLIFKEMQMKTTLRYH